MPYTGIRCRTRVLTDAWMIGVSLIHFKYICYYNLSLLIKKVGIGYSKNYEIVMICL